VAAAAAAPLSPWPMRQGNSQGTGQSTATGPTSSAKTLRCSGVPSTNVPAVGADGTLYQPSTNGALFAISASDGSPLWTFTPKSGSAASTQGQTHFQTLFAISASDGSPMWASTPGSASTQGQTPALSTEGKVVFYAADAIYSLDATSGAVNWSWNATLSANNFRALLRGKNDALYAVIASQALVALDGATGAVSWTQIGVFADIALSPDGTIIYAVVSESERNGGIIACIDAASGTVQWKRNMNIDTAAAPGWAAPLVSATGQLVLSFMTICNPAGDSRYPNYQVVGINMTLFDPTLFTSVWSTCIYVSAMSSCQFNFQFSAPTLVMGSTLVMIWSCANGEAGGIVGVSMVSGTLIWATPGLFLASATSGLPSPVAGADSTVYTSNISGTVFGINSGTGAAIWSIPASNINTPPFAAIAGNKRLALGNCLYVEGV
jgi:outer membrane protein assembly factor BamB